MHITFWGAAREVTGSCHLVEVDGRSVLLDCGLVQSGPGRHQRNRDPFPFEPSSLSACVLSHAHIDHCGRLPLLRRRGFTGPIYCTAATASLCEILLRDSAHIQEEDARWKIKRLRKAGQDYSWVTPTYTVADAETVLEQLIPVAYDTPVDVAAGIGVRFRDAGHILGSGIVELFLQSNGEDTSLTFSGDLGSGNMFLIPPPTTVPAPDVLLMESTYGLRDREPVADLDQRLTDIVERTFARGGNVVIPAFAVGRTQEILARLDRAVAAGRLQGVEVFVDSPLAIRATRIFREHRECYAPEAVSMLTQGDDPLSFIGLHHTLTVEESKSINKRQEPAVIISASGMCDAGRIKHHLLHNVGRPESTIVLVGYQAQGSLGRRLQNGEPKVKIFGEMHRVRAEVVNVTGLSAHADRQGLRDWTAAMEGKPKRVFLIHGEEDSVTGLAATLAEDLGVETTAPHRGECFDLA